MRAFEGFDHIDCRVRCLAAVEAFYDKLMPELGLPTKRLSHVDAAGDWQTVSPERPYNAAEYYQEGVDGAGAPFFIGVIEYAGHQPTLTRIAFRVSRARMFELETQLAPWGARSVERSADLQTYPAIFFDDPDGNKLELVSRD